MNCAPCITRLFSGHLACPVPEKGVSGTEYPSCTGNACFLHRMSSENASRTGGSLFEHGAHIPYRRRPSPVPNSANARKEESIACTECFKRQKGEGHGPEHDPECRREQENNSLRPQNTPANSTTTQRPTTATHSANKKHHQYKAPPASTVTPPGCPKSPLLKVQSAFWAILAGVELTEGVLYGQAPPQAQKKKSRLNVTSIGTSEKRQLPTLPPGGAVPSALVSLTSLFGMGRGGSSPL